MTRAEIAEMEAFYELEPWGCRPADERAAMIAWSVFRSQGVKVERSDFIFQRGIDPPPPDVAAGGEEAALERFFRGGAS
jgi:hypothetical protein